MQAASFEEVLEQILTKEQRYHRDAYLFLRDGLEYTRKLAEREAKAEKSTKRSPAVEQHVTGQQLLEGLRELAMEMFGPMAMTVLAEWGIHTCEDFGEMVFIMVENRLLKKTEKDSRADFQNGYDFHDSFCKPFLPKSKLHSNPPAAKTANA